MSKRYEQEYFDRWYRSSRAVVRPAAVQRKVRLAVAATEYLLDRELRTVLDIGCGEAPWRAYLRRMRPDVEYTGVDPSEYAVRRFGRRRDILLGSLTTLDQIGLARSYDLIVCSDVLQYLTNAEVRKGLRMVAKRLGGVAFIEAFTAKDDMIGDRDLWHERSATWYRRAFAAAGLTQVGLYTFVGAKLLPVVNELERCS